MAENIDQNTLGVEFDVFIARAGISVPLDRRAGILAGYAEFRAQIALLHAPRPHTAEMANIFRLTAGEAKP